MWVGYKVNTIKTAWVVGEYWCSWLFWVVWAIKSSIWQKRDKPRQKYDHWRNEPGILVISFPSQIVFLSALPMGLMRLLMRKERNGLGRSVLEELKWQDHDYFVKYLQLFKMKRTPTLQETFQNISFAGLTSSSDEVQAVKKNLTLTWNMIQGNTLFGTSPSGFLTGSNRRAMLEH